MKRHHTCGTCMHFRPGAEPDMTMPAPIESDEDLGVCELTPPQPELRPLGPPVMFGMQPGVHASRSCPEYMPHTDWDGDDGDGESVPGPRRKFSLHSFPKAAA